MTCPLCTHAVDGPGRCAHCGFDVPEPWLTHTQVSIAMTGARTAGKSVLIGVMMDQLERFIADHHRTYLEPLGDTRSRLEEMYLNPLYAQRKLIKSTPPAALQPLKPLMWSFSARGVDYCLSLIDAAGEDFEQLDPTDDTFAYLGRVDLIVCLVDPLKVPGVAAVLDGLVTVPQDSGSDLHVLRQVLQARRAHSAEAPIEQYLALTLSKFDVLQQLRSVPAAPWQSIMNRPGSPMQRDPSMATPGEDPDDGDLLQAELTGLLTEMKADLLLALAEQGGLPFRLFATSALGMPPSSEAVNRGGITPYRVLDLPKAALAIKGLDA